MGCSGGCAGGCGWRTWRSSDERGWPACAECQCRRCTCGSRFCTRARCSERCCPSGSFECACSHDRCSCYVDGRLWYLTLTYSNVGTFALYQKLVDSCFWFWYEYTQYEYCTV